MGRREGGTRVNLVYPLRSLSYNIRPTDATSIVSTLTQSAVAGRAKNQHLMQINTLDFSGNRASPIASAVSYSTRCFHFKIALFFWSPVWRMLPSNRSYREDRAETDAVQG